MAVTLRASKAGLRIVDIVRRCKGWKATAPIWCDAANTSQATLRRFRQGKPIQEDTFIGICKAVGVDWEEIVDISNLPFTLSQRIESKKMLALVDELIFRETDRHLNRLQRIILEGVWEGKTYKEIGYNNDYSQSYIRQEASNLYRRLSNILVENIRKSNFVSVLKRLMFSRDFSSTLFQQAEATDTNAILQNLQRLNASLMPSGKERIDSETWTTIHRLYYLVVSEVLAIQQSASHPARSLALNRLLGELQTIRDKPKNIPPEERQLIIDIAETWQKALLSIAGEVGKITIT